MTMTLAEQLVTIGMVALGTMLTRFLPFIVFPADKETPAYMQYLGKVLPAAVFGLLIVYCMKDVSVFSESHGIPELISIAAVVLLHMWKRQMLLSIAEAKSDDSDNHHYHEKYLLCIPAFVKYQYTEYDRKNGAESCPYCVSYA